MNDLEHWTGDEEMRERYVLHRIDEETMRFLDEHLRDCPSCREVIERERRIATTVRRAGRDSLKDRIARRARETTASATPWPKVIAAAALVTIVVGVGTYFRWFETRTTTVGHETSDITLDDRVVAKDGKEAGNARGNISPDSAVSFAAKLREEPVQAKQSGRAAKPAAANEVNAPGAPASVLQRGGDHNVTTESARRVEAQSYGKALAQGAPVTFWMDGVLLGGPNDVLRDKQKEDAALSLARKDEQLEKKAEEAVPAEQERYRVAQMPLTTLPKTQQFRQQGPGAKTVQTEILRQDGTVRITLFTETQFDPDDLAHARVQQIGSDSLVVQLRNQAIGYRLPAGWDAK